MKKALIVWGGWEGHEPRACAELFAPLLGDRGFDVAVEDSLEVFADRERLGEVNLIVPMWTMGELTDVQETTLLEAIAGGVGIAGFHGGMGDAFRRNTRYQFMVGGQFVEHPDGIKDYLVEVIHNGDPITNEIDSFTVRSEQYYMHVDPCNQVLANTRFETESAPWVNGCVMPVVWKRNWGDGRVFYSSLGHVAADFDVPQVLEIQKRGMLWAAR